MKAIQTDRDLEAWIVERVAQSIRIPQPEVEKEAASLGLASRRVTRDNIRALLNDGRLMYTYELGTSFLCESFMGVSRLGKMIVVVPPGHRSSLPPGDVPVVMRLGAAFGSGRHPTTRMAILAMEEILAPGGKVISRPGQCVLDVGSGTGILGLAALCLGMDRAVATDIDPCAVFDTKENAALNGMSQRLTASDTAIPGISGRFSLILANLRLPTLLEALPVFSRVLIRPGHLIVSGIQVHEISVLEQAALEHGFEFQEKMIEHKWACVIFFSEKTIRS